MIRKILIITSLFAASTLFAASFTIQHIRYVGLDRISTDTVQSYMPVEVGQTYRTSDGSKIISDLYDTGFFSNVSLDRSANTLIVNLTERPIISSVNIVGNHEIPKDKLNDALQKMGLAKGRVFKKATLKEVEHALTEQYYNTGRYNARVETDVKKEVRNRVAITINVSEGMIAQVKKITIIGNYVFNESTLIDQLTLSTPGFFSFFTSSDQYGKPKLDKSLQSLQDYYFNHGYIKMQVKSTQVTLTPDRKQVYIVINLKEGGQYKFGKFVFKGDLILPRQELRNMVPIQAGQVFSRQLLMQTNKAITTRLGNEGFAFAKVNILPDINDKTRIVTLTFEVQPGQRYYIRNISFSGSPNTTNLAFRNNFLQFEDSVYQGGKIQESVRNLRQLPYIKAEEIKVTPKPVPGSNNQVDLNVHTTPKMAADINFTFGYSQLSKFVVGASLNQRNFMGTGNTVGISATHSAIRTAISASYTNPFFTPNGISQTISAYLQTTKPGASNDLADYSTSGYGANVSYGFPISNYQRFSLGGGFEHTKLEVGSPSLSDTVNSFTGKHGTTFNQLLLTAGWTYNTFNRFIFPTSGFKQSLNGTVSVPVSSHGSLQYYILTYENRWYQPIVGNFILTTRSAVGFGDGYGPYDALPFFKNFYAGGINGLGENRAFAPNALGPRDRNPKSNATLGGNLLLDGSLGIILPTQFISDKIRATLFVDAGNVFDTKPNKNAKKNQTVRLEDLRYSTGIQVEWWTPLGAPLVFSLAMPIGFHSSDDTTQIFQFSIGGAF